MTRDGAREEAVRAARDAIEARTDLPAADTDHLAVLWFIAEAEDVPVRVMKEYISEGRLMASTLYQSIFEKGEARGEARGGAVRLHHRPRPDPPGGCAGPCGRGADPGPATSRRWRSG